MFIISDISRIVIHVTRQCNDTGAIGFYSLYIFTSDQSDLMLALIKSQLFMLKECIWKRYLRNRMHFVETLNSIAIESPLFFW